MPRWKLNRSTLQMEIAKPELLTEAELLTKVKRAHHVRITAQSITDDDLIQMIKKVQSGTRNIHYIVPTEKMKYWSEVGYFLLREYQKGQ